MAKLMLVTTDDLRRMWKDEGIIFPGCGGDLNEWIDGVNEMLTEEGILLNGTKFSEVSVFKHNNLTNLLFHFTGDVELSIGRLAIWRIATNDQFSAKWLSDYVDNYLGGFEGQEEDLDVGESDGEFDIQ